MFSYFNLCRHYYAQTLARSHGVIVNIIGLAGVKADAGYITSSAGNAALIHLMRTLGGQAPSGGVRVVGINPALTATDHAVSIVRYKAERAADSGRFEAEFLAGLPFGRMAKPEEVADLTSLLCSDRAG